MSQHWWFSLGAQSQFHTRLELKAGINGGFFYKLICVLRSSRAKSPCQRLFLIHSPLCQYVCQHSELDTRALLNMCNKNNSCFIVYLAMALSHLFMEVITSKLMKISNNQFDIRIQTSLLQKAWDCCQS